MAKAKPTRWRTRKRGRHVTWMKTYPSLGIYGFIRRIDERFYSVFLAEHWTGGEDEPKILFSGDTPTLDGAKRTVELFAEEAETRGVPNVGKRKKAGNPHRKGSSSRPGYRVCARTISGGWANKATDLSGPEADKLMRKLKREGFEVAKFKGRKRVK